MTTYLAPFWKPEPVQPAFIWRTPEPSCVLAEVLEKKKRLADQFAENKASSPRPPPPSRAGKLKVQIDVDRLKKFLADGKSKAWCARYYECDHTTIDRRLADDFKEKYK